MKIRDLNIAPRSARTDVLSSMTPETLSAFAKLTDLLSVQRSFIPKEIPLTRREYEKKFTQWIAADVPEAIRQRAAMISLNKSYDAAMEFLRMEFDKQHAHLRPTKKVGRPEWYITPIRERRLLQGEVIARLINLAGEELMQELQGDHNVRACR